MTEISRVRSFLFLVFLPVLILWEGVLGFARALKDAGQAYASGWRGLIYGNDEHGWEQRRDRANKKYDAKHPLMPCGSCGVMKEYEYNDHTMGGQRCRNYGCYRSNE